MAAFSALNQVLCLWLPCRRKGIGSTLYISAGALCQHTAQQIAQQLKAHANIDRLSSTAANTGLIAHALTANAWKVSHSMNLMVRQQTPQCRTQQRFQMDVNAATSAEQGQHSTHQQQQQEDCTQQQQQQQQQLKLEVCSPCSPEDTALVLDWCGSFLAHVFHLPGPPPAAQLSAMVLPRLQCGLYSVLKDGSQAVCMIGHVPTSNSSTRITMLYTPEEFRGKGYGRIAGVFWNCNH